MKSRINKKPHAGIDVGPIEERIRTCRLFSFFYPGCKRPQINPASAECRPRALVCQTRGSSLLSVSLWLPLLLKKSERNAFRSPTLMILGIETSCDETSVAL